MIKCYNLENVDLNKKRGDAEEEDNLGEESIVEGVDLNENDEENELEEDDVKDSDIVDENMEESNENSDSNDNSSDDEASYKGKKKMGKNNESNILKMKSIGKSRTKIYNSMIEKEKRKDFFSEI